ncbi:MAG: hypothetical protein QM679_04395 [Patulibacter sp.]
MPTAHPRHSITETPELALLLDQLRARLGSAMPTMAELVRRGALGELREVEARERARQRDLETFLDRMVDGPAPDLAEADAIRRAQRTP